MSRKFQFVILALLVGSCALTGCGQEASAAVSDALSPAQIKQQAMDDAAYYNAFIVEFNYELASADDQYAICNGTTRIVGLDKGETRRVELTTQEEANASLCKLSKETGNYSTVQDISGVKPGDYLLWDSCLHWTRYTTS